MVKTLKNNLTLKIKKMIATQITELALIKTIERLNEALTTIQSKGTKYNDLYKSIDDNYQQDIVPILSGELQSAESIYNTIINVPGLFEECKNELTEKYKNVPVQ
jgi:hypothetical protein